MAINLLFRMKNTMTAIILASTSLLYSCQKDETTVTQYRALVVTDDLSIGRVLFYDNKLSVDNKTACASCHHQEFAFADNKAFSDGFGIKKSARNTIAIQNLGPSFVSFGFPVPGFSGNRNGFFWDGREKNLNKLMLEPIVNHREMGILDLEDLCNRLENIDYYQELFQRDYNTTTITPDLIAGELESFVTKIRTNSRFDQRMGAGLPGGNTSFTDIEELGMKLFFNKYNCSQCHMEQNPGGGYQGDSVQSFGGFADIGLPNVTDPGLGAVTGKTQDNGRFRIPALRNVALTAPYMHDGSIQSLDAVLEHYSTGIEGHGNLDRRLKDEFGAPKRFNISKAEKEAIIAFLHTMTDYNMIKDPMLSDPFIVVEK